MIKFLTFFFKQRKFNKIIKVYLKQYIILNNLKILIYFNNYINTNLNNNKIIKLFIITMKKNYKKKTKIK